MIKVSITKNDSSTVAKAVIIDDKGRVLFLKRSKYVNKFAGDWDLPGGHLKVSESLPAGLNREVKEETTLVLRDPVFLLQMDNIHFFSAMYDSQPIKLSQEHTDFKFFEENELNPNEKFQKVAIRALELNHKK